jgi:hypothetical protein
VLIQYVASWGHGNGYSTLLGFRPALCRDPEKEGSANPCNQGVGGRSYGMSCEQYDDDGGKARLVLQILQGDASDDGESSPRGPHGVGVVALQVSVMMMMVVAVADKA